MKKELFFLLFSFLFFQLSYAQFTFGAKAGVNLSNVDLPDINSKNRTGFQIGVLAEIPFGKRIYFSSEVLYSSQGFKLVENIKETESPNELITELGYLQAPFIFKYRIIEGLNIQAGPQMGLLISAVTRGPNSKQDDKYLYSDFDYGMTFGLGYKFYPSLFVQARYNMGFGTIYEKDKLQIAEIENNAKNKVIHFSVGYMF